MNIFISREKIDSLEELRLRRAELKAEIDQQRDKIENTVSELRRDFRPAKIIKNIAVDFFKSDSSDSKDDGKSGFASNMKLPLQLASDLLVRDPRIAIALRLVTPLVFKFLPELGNIADKVRSSVPGRAKLLSALRNNVSKLRKKIPSKKHKIAESTDLN